MPLEVTKAALDDAKSRLKAFGLSENSALLCHCEADAELRQARDLYAINATKKMKTHILSDVPIKYAEYMRRGPHRIIPCDRHVFVRGYSTRLRYDIVNIGDFCHPHPPPVYLLDRHLLHVVALDEDVDFYLMSITHQEELQLHTTAAASLDTNGVFDGHFVEYPPPLRRAPLLVRHASIVFLNWDGLCHVSGDKWPRLGDFPTSDNDPSIVFWKLLDAWEKDAPIRAPIHPIERTVCRQILAALYEEAQNRSIVTPEFRHAWGICTTALTIESMRNFHANFCGDMGVQLDHLIAVYVMRTRMAHQKSWEEQSQAWTTILRLTADKQNLINASKCKYAEFHTFLRSAELTAIEKDGIDSDDAKAWYNLHYKNIRQLEYCDVESVSKLLMWRELTRNKPYVWEMCVIRHARKLPPTSCSPTNPIGREMAVTRDRNCEYESVIGWRSNPLDIFDVTEMMANARRRVHTALLVGQETSGTLVHDIEKLLRQTKSLRQMEECHTMLHDLKITVFPRIWDNAKAMQYSLQYRGYCVCRCNDIPENPSNSQIRAKVEYVLRGLGVYICFGGEPKAIFCHPLSQKVKGRLQVALNSYYSFHAMNQCLKIVVNIPKLLKAAEGAGAYELPFRIAGHSIALHRDCILVFRGVFQLTTNSLEWEFREDAIALQQ